jgi:hypothetical protein
VNGTWYAVTWTRYGQKYLIDCDTQEMALELSTRLAGQRGAVAIAVQAVEERHIDAEQRERVRERIWQRLYEQEYIVPLREAVGART